MNLTFPSTRMKFLGVLLSVVWLNACGTETKETAANGTATADYASLWTQVFSRCGGCHGVSSNTETEGGPDLRTQAGAYSALVGVKGSAYSSWTTFQRLRSECAGKAFIQAGSAKDSMVVAVLDSSVSLGSCAVVNHQATGKVNVSAANLAVLKQWIDAGAKQ